MYYECIANCPELDETGETHCRFTQTTIDYSIENNTNLCPCGNNEDLEKRE